MHDTENQYQNTSQNPPPAEGTRPNVYYTSLPNRVLDLQAEGKLSVYAVSVGLWLARYARQKNECFPSVDTLVGKLHVSRTSVYTGLKELEAAGLLKTRKRSDRGGNHNFYKLCFWGPLDCAANTPDKVSPLTTIRANVHNTDVQTPTTGPASCQGFSKTRN
jgi:predicted transcriptional regulator